MPKPVLNEENIDDEKAKLLKELCPVNVFEIEEGKLVVARPQDCIGCKACEAQCEECVKIVED